MSLTHYRIAYFLTFLLVAGIFLFATITPVHAATAETAGGACPSGTYANGVCVGDSTNGLPAGTTANGNILNSANQSTPSGINLAPLTGYKTGIIDFINSLLVPVLIAISFLVFLWGIAKAYIIQGASETERAKGHQIILWGIIGFVVIFSLWGIVNLVMAVLGLAGGGTAASANIAPPQL